MGRLLGYVRVSTDEQVTDLQRDALARVGVAASDCFADDGVSGTKPALSRPGFRALLEVAERGDTICAYALSRLGRSTLDVLALLRDLEERGIGFRSVTEPIDTTTHVGKLVLTILAAVAEMERSVLVERTRDGVAAARARGVRVGRPPISEDKRQAVRALVASGMAPPKVATTLGLGRATVFRILAEGREPAASNTPTKVVDFALDYYRDDGAGIVPAKDSPFVESYSSVVDLVARNPKAER